MTHWLETLRSLPGTIVSASAETINLHPFEGLIPNLVLVTSFKHSWIDLWRQHGISVFCLEDHIPLPPVSTKQLLCHAKTLEFLQTLPEPVRILIFKPSQDLEQSLARHGMRLLNAPSQIARLLENKLNLSRLASESGVDALKEIQVTLDEHTLETVYHEKWELPIVIQTAKGFSGNRTFIVRDPESMAQVVSAFPGRRCRITRFNPGITWTANACIMDADQILTSPPFIQITVLSPGKKSLPETAGSRGNIWTTPPESLSHTIQSQMLKIGSTLATKGFKGVWGADFLEMQPTGHIQLVEINPRLVASLPSQTPIHILQSTPILACHIIAMAGSRFPEPPVLKNPISGGQIILKGEMRDKALCRDIKASGYYFMGEKLQWSRPGWSSARLQEGECLVWHPENPCIPETQRIICQKSSVFSKIASELFKSVRTVPVLE
jgi:hypothetical protein